MVSDLAEAAAPPSAQLDRDRIERRQAVQLIGDDDDIIACVRNSSGFPVRRIVPVPCRVPLRVVAIQTTAAARPAGNRNRDVLGGGRALRIRHRHRIGERQGLALGDEIREVDRKVGERPVDRSAAGPRAVMVGHNRAVSAVSNAAIGAGASASSASHIECRRAVSGQRRVRQLGRHRMGVGQIDIGKGQRSRGRCVSDRQQIRRRACLCRPIRPSLSGAGGDDRDVVGAGDR